ncbi:hypothetical protein L9F63_003952, partial [Diploptera punctata]
KFYTTKDVWRVIFSLAPKQYSGLIQTNHSRSHINFNYRNNCKCLLKTCQAQRVMEEGSTVNVDRPTWTLKS